MGPSDLVVGTVAADRREDAEADEHRSV